MTTYMCCNQCFENLAKKDTTAAKLWIDLCAYACKLGVFGFVEARTHHSINPLRTLESMGYLKSADGLDMVKMRMMGHQVVEIQETGALLNTFCMCREEHGHEWQ